MNIRSAGLPAALTVIFACGFGACGASPREPDERAPGGDPIVPTAGQAAAPPTTPLSDLGTQPTLLPAVPTATAKPDGAADAGDVCKAESAAAEQVPVDVFMMIDQSVSMAAPEPTGMSRWDSVIAALTKFVQAPESAGLSIGVQYFGLGLLGISCTVADYALPEVEIAPLPGNAEAIVKSFGMHGPSSITPTAPALQGAIQHAQAFKLAHPSHAVTVLLVTDGEPDSCGLLSDTVTAAMQGVTATPSISTYVLGVGGSLDALNQIAKAGGTGQAYIVSDSQNVSAEVVMALNRIRGQAVLPCEFQIPAADPGQKFDYDKVNLSYTTSAAQTSTIGYAPDVTTCNRAALAWRYDNAQAPSKIVLCDTTCESVTSAGGKLDIALHCPTVPVVLQ
jgi:Mg-chelatase subunit ChlD